VVGSANASTNGLGLEQDEVAGWREIGMLSDDPGDLRSAAAGDAHRLATPTPSWQCPPTP
jgi:hypothetical protein